MTGSEKLAEPLEIAITRDGTAPVEVAPRSVEVDADALGVPCGERSGIFRLDAGEGWMVEPVGELRWRLTAREIDVDRSVEVRLHRRANGKASNDWSCTIPVRLDLRSTFDPVRHTFPEPNRASVLGDINPQREIFERTFALPGKLLGEWLYSGLYSDIVFLRRDGPTRGGLCSGMARWAIARSQGIEPEPASREDALRRITTYHGRQLRDRAFLMGAPWFLRASPKAAYRAVRRDLLRTGMTDRAFDVAVPKPWRRDVVEALIGQGHTIVPYRVIQESPDRARVEVYDPNRPPATLETPEVVEFDLKNDRYGYRHMVSLAESKAGLVAVRQSAYSGRGTAILASLASAGLKLVQSFGKRRAQ